MKRIAISTCLILLILSLAAPVQAGRLPDTGQAKCYNDTGTEIPCPLPGEAFYGQDGNYNINEPSYTKLSAAGDALPYTATTWAMVQDNVTKLTWELKSDDLSIHDRDNTYTWDLVNAFFIGLLNGTQFGGYSDWRLPSVKELTAIVDRNTYNPAINPDFFPNTMQVFGRLYWTSTIAVPSGSDAWAVDFFLGHFTDLPKSVARYVRAVRGAPPQERIFWNNGDGSVTDEATGLMWQQETAGPMVWADALAYCEALPLTQAGGYTDWRLPNVTELQSLVDYGDATPPVINIQAFPGTQLAFYWSSTSRFSAPANGWVVDFRDGESDTESKSDKSHHVRAVRGGQNKRVGHLFILTPNQASRWVIGRPVPITWETPPEITGNVKILVSHDGGKTFDTTIADTTENDGSYEWQAAGPDSVNCVLKIDPLDEPFQDKGTTQGLFTVRTNEAPSQPSSPTPADQASEQSLDVDLSWAPSTDPDEGDTVTYTVYFGTAAIPQSQAPVAEGHTTTTFDPGMLSCSGIYFWQIVAVDNHAAASPGPVWRFSTTSVPGDVSGDCAVDLTDAILTFQVLSGLTPAQPVFAGGAVNGEGNNGPEQGIYILQEIGGLR